LPTVPQELVMDLVEKLHRWDSWPMLIGY
jgi:hypothetical protein